MYPPVGHAATQQAGSGGLTATEHRLDNGLRLVLSEDHLTPVAAVCLWYDVGYGRKSRAVPAWLTFSSTSCFRVRRRSKETATSS